MGRGIGVEITFQRRMSGGGPTVFSLSLRLNSWLGNTYFWSSLCIYALETRERKVVTHFWLTLGLHTCTWEIPEGPMGSKTQADLKMA